VRVLKRELPDKVYAFDDDADRNAGEWDRRIDECREVLSVLHVSSQLGALVDTVR
jgi:hypothetical protein